jgi:hypothetical protein
MRLGGGFGSIIFHMAIDTGETRLQTISRLQAFLAGTLEVHFCVPNNDGTNDGTLQNKFSTELAVF